MDIQQQQKSAELPGAAVETAAPTASRPIAGQGYAEQRSALTPGGQDLAVQQAALSPVQRDATAPGGDPQDVATNPHPDAVQRDEAEGGQPAEEEEPAAKPRNERWKRCAYALKGLIEYENANGTFATIKRYHPLANALLTPLNENIPSIYGLVDVDWMLRLSFTQVMSVGADWLNGDSEAGKRAGSVYAKGGYVLAKGFWNVVRSFSSSYELEFESMLEEANLNAPAVVVEWIHGKPLRTIFAPAIKELETPNFKIG